MEGGGAYGAGKATGQFDPIAYVKKPEVILRAVSWLFSIIVFACISSEGWFEGSCAYNNDANACGYGVTIGVLAFLGLMGFLVVDALFDNISSVQQRKYAVMADIGFCGIWTFLWFVGFCYLTDAWRKTEDEFRADFKNSAVEAAIAFSFFSICTFAALTVLAVMKYRAGVTETFEQGPTGGPTDYGQGYGQNYAPDGMGGGTGQPAPQSYNYPQPGVGGGGGGGATDPYQQQAPPFSQQTEQKQPPPAGDFQPPTY